MCLKKVGPIHAKYWLFLVCLLQLVLGIPIVINHFDLSLNNNRARQCQNHGTFSQLCYDES